jgi:transcriptional regulator with XRE-family HTH domain
MLAKNLTDLRNEKGITQGDLAKVIGISRSTYAGYEKGKSEPTASILIKLADFFQVKTDELLRDQIPMPLFRPAKQTARLLQEDLRVLAVTVNTKQEENIQYVPVAAQAGYVSEYGQPEFIKRLPHFQLPKLSKNATYRAFDVQGDSMPPIHDGYILVCRYVQSHKEIKSGKRYVLITKSEGIVFKKVVCDSTRMPRLILISDNPKYLPYSIDLGDVLEAWEMVAFIGYPTVYEDMTHILNDRLQVIEEKINNIKTTKS